MSAEHSGTRKWKAKHSEDVDVKVVGIMSRKTIFTIFHIIVEYIIIINVICVPIFNRINLTDYDIIFYLCELISVLYERKSSNCFAF